MPTGVVEAGGDQVLHAQLAHVAKRHRRAGILLPVRRHAEFYVVANFPFPSKASGLSIARRMDL
jgi:hypothetical protein